jgi:hypothetical protein
MGELTRGRRAGAQRRRVQTRGEEVRRGGGLRRLPEALVRVLDPAARRRGLAEAKLLTEWSTIVGPWLAARCQPVRLSHGAGGPERVLSLHVAGAAALELQHSEPQLLERINGFFGYPAVTRLRLLQAPLPRRITAPAPPAIPSLSDADEVEVAEAVRGVRDPGLQAALAGLGRTLKRRRGASATRSAEAGPSR